MKIKIKSHDDDATDFYNKEILKVDSDHTCLAVINLNFVCSEQVESSFINLVIINETPDEGIHLSFKQNFIVV